jgi:ornithine cyclodeaminase/alanine dehydrogenase-like protein (mu-crystallin family)
MLYLSRKDVEAVNLSMPEIIDALERMFKEKGKGRVQMPPKPEIHPGEDGLIHAMPAYIPSLHAAGLKWVSAYKENSKKNLPYISGLVILNDPETGIPIAVMDATWITAKRTGAATAIAAKYLAREESSSVGILGCGVQGRSNLEALSCEFNIDRVKVYDICSDAAGKFAQDMAEIIQMKIDVVDNPKEAVREMDLVVTCGPLLRNPSPIIEADWLAEGAFAGPVDFDSYWKGEALWRAERFATDDIAQMEYYREIGYFKNTPQPYADLGEIAAGKKPGRQNPSERIICMNLGLALDDMAAGIMIYRKAIEMGIGAELSL